MGKENTVSKVPGVLKLPDFTLLYSSFLATLLFLIWDSELLYWDLHVPEANF